MKYIYIVLFVLISKVVLFSQPINIDFSQGNLSGWTLQEAGNLNSISMATTTYSASSEYSIISSSSTEINNVPITMASPLGGDYIRFGKTIYGGNVYKLSQTYTVDASSQSLQMSYAIVLEDGSHTCSEQPYFNIRLRDSIGNIIPGFTYKSIIGGAICTNTLGGDFSYSTLGYYKYKNWNNLSYNLSSHLGKKITIEILVAGCNLYQSAHTGYAYFDASYCNNSTQNYITVNGTNYNLLQPVNSLTLCSGTNNINIPWGATSFLWSGGAINGATSQSVSITQDGVYSVTYNKPSACSNSTTVNFTVLPTQTVAITGSTTVCEGNNVYLYLNPSGITNYTWTVLPIGTNTAVGSVGSWGFFTIKPNADVVVRLYANDINTCIGYNDYTVTVLPSPTITVAGDSILCSGSSSTLTASGANTYTWSTGSYSNSIIVSPTSTTIYTVTGKFTSNGCSNKITKVVKYNQPIIITYDKLKYCTGDSATIVANGALSYTWSNGATSSIVKLKPTTTTSYTVSGLTTCGIKQTVFTVTVDPLPNINATANTPSTCVSNPTVQLTATGGLNNFSYTWNNGVNSHLIVVTPTVTSTYTVTGVGANGCKKTASVTVIIHPVPTISLNVTPPVNVCGSQSVTLTASGANSYTWTNSAIPNTTTLSTTSPSIIVTPTSTLGYYVYGADVNGCIIIKGTTVFVNSSSPTYTIASPTKTICEGQPSGQWTISSPNYNIYTCSQANTSFTNSFGLYFEVNPSPSVQTIYTINATNGCGTTSNTVMIVPNGTPVLSLLGPTLVCLGSPVTYTASGGSYYTIKNDVLNNAYFTSTITFTPLTSTTQSITICNSLGCYNTQTVNLAVVNGVLIPTSNYSVCIGNSVTLNANSASTYTWSTGDNTSSTTVTPTINSTYTVTGGTSGCIASKTISVNIVPIPTISVNSGTVCAGSVFIMQPSGANSYYTFSNGSPYASPLISTTYTVTGINNTGCSATNISSVTVNPAPIITVNSGSICASQIFTITPSGGTTYFYSSITNTVAPLVTTNYIVTGTDNTNCVNTATSNVLVDTPILNPTSNSNLICIGGNAIITANGAASYTWSTGANSNSIVITPSVNTTYTVTGEGVNGCISSASITQSVSICTNIDNLSNVDQQFIILIYPNPNNGSFTIELTSDSKIFIVNTLGQELINTTLNSGNNQINLNNVASGIYFVKVICGNLQTTKRIFVY